MPTQRTPRQEFAGRLVEGIRRAGLTQRRFAAKLGVTEAAVSKWTNERTEPDLETLSRMARILGVSLDWLLGSPGADVPLKLPARVDPKAVRRAVRKLREVAVVAEQLAAALPDDDE